MKFKKFIKESLNTPETNSIEELTEDKTDTVTKEDSCSDYKVKKYGAYWFGVLGPDGLMLKDSNKKLYLFRSKQEASNFINDLCGSLTECSESNTVVEETNREKLMRAFPELELNKPVVEEIQNLKLSNSEKLKQAYPELNFEKKIVEELTVREKLKAAYPELDFDKHLTESTGSETVHMIKDAMTVLSKEDKNKWATTVAEIADVIPDSFADELFDKIREKFSNLHLNSSDRKRVVDASGVSDTSDIGNTLGKILDFIDTRDDIEKNPDFIKTLVITILGIVAVIEPTPVLEIITGIVAAVPSNIVAKIMSILQLTNPIVGAAAIAKSVMNKNSVSEELESDMEYDDDYVFDDVEEDRRHAALYGGDLTYCKHCGARLKRNEWGGYCPECEPEDSNNE